MGAIPHTYGIEGEPKTPMGPGPVAGFGEVPGPVEQPRGGTRGGRDIQGEDTEHEGAAKERELRDRGGAGKQGHHLPGHRHGGHIHLIRKKAQRPMSAIKITFDLSAVERYTSDISARLMSAK